MPGAIIRTGLYNLSLGSLRDLKRRWHVPMEALIDRAYHLNHSPRQTPPGCVSDSTVGLAQTRTFNRAPETPELVAKIGRDLAERDPAVSEIAQISSGCR